MIAIYDQRGTLGNSVRALKLASRRNNEFVNVWCSLANPISRNLNCLPIDGVNDEPMEQDDKRHAPVQKYVFTPNPSMLGASSSTLAPNLHSYTLKILAEMQASRRPRSLTGEMNPSEMIDAQIADRQAREMEPMELKEKCQELQHVTHPQQAEQNSIEGTENAIAMASVDVLKEVDIRKKRHDELRTMRRAAFIAVERSQMVSTPKPPNCDKPRKT